MNRQKVGSGLLLFFIGLILILINISFLNIPLGVVAGIILFIISFASLKKETKNKKFTTALIVVIVFSVVFLVTKILTINLSLNYLDKLFQYLLIDFNENPDGSLTVGSLKEFADFFDKGSNLVLISMTVSYITMILTPVIVFILKGDLASLTNSKSLKDGLVKNGRFQFIFGLCGLGCCLLLGIAFSVLFKSCNKMILDAIQGYDDSYIIEPNMIKGSAEAIYSIAFVGMASLLYVAAVITTLVFTIKFIVNVWNLRKEYVANQYSSNNNQPMNYDQNGEIIGYDPQTGRPVYKPRFNSETGEPLE